MTDLALRGSALRTGVRLEVLTVSWMAVEAALAIAAGVAARSVLLTAFGADSVIELISGGVLLWRLGRESSGRSLEPLEAIEGRATRISALLLTLLCASVLLSSIAGLILQVRPEPSALGIGVAAVALLVMPLLAWRKRAINRTIDSAALRADVAETITCAYLAGTTLVGVGLAVLTGWWWVEYLAAFALLFWLVREAVEAFESARESGEDLHHG